MLICAKQKLSIARSNDTVLTVSQHFSITISNRTKYFHSLHNRSVDSMPNRIAAFIQCQWKVNHALNNESRDKERTEKIIIIILIVYRFFVCFCIASIEIISYINVIDKYIILCIHNIYIIWTIDKSANIFYTHARHNLSFCDLISLLNSLFHWRNSIFLSNFFTLLFFTNAFSKMYAGLIFLHSSTISAGLFITF